MRSRGASTSTVVSGVVQTMAIAALAVVTVLLCALAFQHTADAGPTSGTSASETSATTDDPSAPAPSASPSPTSPPEPGGVPRIPDQRRADFAKGDPLPDGSRVYDSSTSSGMSLQDGALVHGRPAGTAAASYLETRLPSDVRKLGATMTFPDGPSGSVALVAWPDSVVDAGRSGADLPESGARLIIGPGSWKLVSGPDREVVTQGEFTPTPGEAVTVELLRDEGTLWVTDPTGRRTSAEAPAAAELAGPWACWALLETSAEQTPAAIVAVWAG